MQKLPILKPQIYIFLVTFGLLFSVFIRGYNPQDEGWVLYGAWRIFEGDIPYRDFQYLYTPLSAFLGALSFAVFDVSILSERIFALFIASSVTVCLFNFLHSLKLSKKVSVLLTGIFVVWGPLHTNYLSPAIISVELGIIYIYLLTKGLNSKHSKTFALFFMTGVAASLIVLTKQTYGAAILVHLLITGCYLLIRQNLRSALYLFSGALSPGAVFILYLLLNNSLTPFLMEMYSFLILDAAAGGFSYQTPFTFPAPFLYKTAKIALYSIPFVISLLGFFLAIKKKSMLFLIPLLTGLFFFVGIQPVLDTIHLSPLIAISGACIGILFSQVNSQRFKITLILLSVCLLTVGIYNGVFRNYFKWFAPIYTSNTPLESTQGKILVNVNDAKIIDPAVEYLNSHADKNEYIFNYGMTPILYFLAQRQSPSKFITIETRNVTGKNLQSLLRDLKGKSPKLIISDEEFRGINPTVESLIMENYLQITTVGGRPVYKLFSF